MHPCVYQAEALLFAEAPPSPGSEGESQLGFTRSIYIYIYIYLCIYVSMYACIAGLSEDEESAIAVAAVSIYIALTRAG